MAAPAARTVYVPTDIQGPTLGEFKQTSVDLLDYSIDFTSLLDAVSDTITGTPAWVVPPGLTASAAANTTKICTNYFTGGTPGQRYVLTVRIATAASTARAKRASFGLTITGAP